MALGRLSSLCSSEAVEEVTTSTAQQQTWLPANTHGERAALQASKLLSLAAPNMLKDQQVTLWAVQSNPLL